MFISDGKISIPSCLITVRLQQNIFIQFRFVSVRKIINRIGDLLSADIVMSDPPWSCQIQQSVMQEKLTLKYLLIDLSCIVNIQLQKFHGSQGQFLFWRWTVSHLENQLKNSHYWELNISIIMFVNTGRFWMTNTFNFYPNKFKSSQDLRTLSTLTTSILSLKDTEWETSLSGTWSFTSWDLRIFNVYSILVNLMTLE